MPIDIETLKAEGKPLEFKPMGKKVDVDELVNMLREQAYTLAELADHFGCAKGTIYRQIRKLREQGYKISTYKVKNAVYYVIEEE